MENEQTVTAQGIADILNIRLETVYRKSKSGEIPGVRIGRAWRYYPSAVQEFLSTPSDPWKLSKGSLAQLRRRK
jgi:excisionase family DNA binding protein